MKKNFNKIFLYAIATISMVAILTGCNSKKETVSEEIVADTDIFEEEIPTDETDVVVTDFEKKYGLKYEDLPEEFSDINIEVYDTIPSLADITKSELFGMSIEQIRAFVSVYEPNYRANYTIGEEKEMEDSDWETVRLLLSYQLFGSIRYNADEDENSLNESEVVENALEETNDSYYNSIEYKNELEAEISKIETMENEELLDYLKQVLVEAGYVNEDGSEIDLSGISEEEIVLIKEELIDLLKDKLSHIVIDDSNEDAYNSFENIFAEQK